MTEVRVGYHKEVKTASFQGKSITVENLTPMLSPKARDKRKREIESCLYTEEFQRITNDISELKNKKSLLMEKQQSDSAANKRIQDAVRLLNNSSAEVTEWDEGMIRQLVDYVKVLAEDRVLICLRGGIEVERFVEKG